jgi:septation ring formation regulator EzrA
MSDVFWILLFVVVIMTVTVAIVLVWESHERKKRIKRLKEMEKALLNKVVEDGH